MHYPISEAKRRDGKCLCNWALNIKYPAPSHGESWSNVAGKDDLIPVVKDWGLTFNVSANALIRPPANLRPDRQLTCPPALALIGLAPVLCVCRASHPFK